MVQKFSVSQLSFYNLLSIKYTNGQKQETFDLINVLINNTEIITVKVFKHLEI